MEQQPLRQVLMIAYLYPPIDNPGIRRVVKFVKYLPQSGYQPLILTTGMRGTLPDDAATRTYRADDLIGPLYRAYRALRFANAPAQSVAQQANIRLLPASNPISRWRERLLLPDTEIVWYPSALRVGRAILRNNPVRLIYSTSSPESDHLVALRLKRASGLPWVADFRDGWMFEPLRPERRRPGLRQDLELALERLVLHHADHVVVVNEVIARDFAWRYPQAASRISVISNGYDADDFAGLQRRSASSERMRIVHTGALALSRGGTSLHGLLAALQSLRAAGHPLIEQLELVLVGRLDPPEQEALARANLGAQLTLTGQVAYRDALQQQLDADLLLLAIAPDTAGVSTSKLYEYLATGRPILALSGPSPAARLITELDAGLVVAPDDLEGIRRALLAFYAQWQAGSLRQTPDPRVGQFERRALTRRLAGVFDTISC